MVLMRFSWLVASFLVVLCIQASAIAEIGVVAYRFEVLKGGVGLACIPYEAARPGADTAYARLKRALALVAADRGTVDGRLTVEADEKEFFRTRRIALTLDLSGSSSGRLVPHLPRGSGFLGRLLPLVATAEAAGAERIFVKVFGAKGAARTWTLGKLVNRLGARAYAFKLRLADPGGELRRVPAWLLLHDVPERRTIWIEAPVERIKFKVSYGRVTYKRAFLRALE